MGKIVETSKLDRLAKALDNRIQAVKEELSTILRDIEELSHDHDNKEFLDSLLEGNIDASSINGYDVWVGTTSELDAIDEKDPNTIYFEIYDGGTGNTEVVQVDVIDGVLTLTGDKYQKTTMVDGTEVVFPDVSGFTEIHLYFSCEEEIDISFPDCKWRMDHNIEAGKSYEIIAVYNTMEWLLNCVVYS